MLGGRQVPAKKMESALELAGRFEQWTTRQGRFPNETAWA